MAVWVKTGSQTRGGCKQVAEAKCGSERKLEEAIRDGGVRKVDVPGKGERFFFDEEIEEYTHTTQGTQVLSGNMKLNASQWKSDLNT